MLRERLLTEKMCKSDEFEIGDMVRHPKFGVGMLIAQDAKTMTVMFDDVGEKKLGKGFVKMEKVDQLDEQRRSDHKRKRLSDE